MEVSTNVTIYTIMERSGRVYLDMTYYIMSMGYSFYFAKAIVWDTNPCKYIDIKDVSKLKTDNLEQPDVKFSYKTLCEY